MSKNPDKTSFSFGLQNFFFRFFLFLVKMCPLSCSLCFGKMLALTAYSLIKHRQKTTIENIQAAKNNGFLQNTPSPEILGRQVWQHLGCVGSEFLYYYTHNPKKLAKRMTIEGEENLKDVLAKGKGVIMASGHIGNWELLGFYLSYIGYPLSPLVKTQDNPLFDNFLNERRKAIGMKTIPRTRFLRPILKAFGRNEVVPFIMDQTDFSGVEVDFFGQPAFFPTGSAEFSLKAGIPIIFMYTFREDKYRHRIVISKAIEPVRTDDLKADIQRTTAELAKMIEETIEKHPGQWLWMHQLWKKRK